ncbi:MAG: M20 family metallopeptidase [Edaphobacter sp.]|uniref:M20 family metallopeptidase n=1 Tax=Edaphobacter sp. TaxID=1934404 RepID=UPI0023845A23|nr:M20 family metallopeptidase [Edaphobacter sp.]MDE1175832.1 M20 family metallopeptidase [Edaphobacter sp.]
MEEKIEARLLRVAEAAKPTILSRTRELVEIESPSSSAEAVNRATALVAEWCRTLGARVRLHRSKGYGDSLEARFGPVRSKLAPILLLGHLDTVWDHGTLKTMPWSVKNGRVSGPGVLDMKAGVAMAITAIEMLLEECLLQRPVILLLHADEEIGSPGSRTLTEKIAAACSAVYVLEPAQGPEGAYKTARKGVGLFELKVQGIASHAGVDFAAGHSAVLELAWQLESIAALTNLKTGVTVNPGLIHGGTRSNVVAAEAEAVIDVRIPRVRDGVQIERRLRALKPRDKACSLMLTGEINRPPMERGRGTVALFRRAQKAARDMGFVLTEAATGGGSDGNFTAGLGIPTLDGMGAVGGGAHAVTEHLQESCLAPRTALLACMML